MTEREMLELAAKAAGIPITPDCHIPSGGIWLFHVDVDRVWNPLADSGDALRLAVALRITIEFDGCYVYANDTGLEVPDDAGAAAEVVRQAIVMAAAEIGRAMP